MLRVRAVLLAGVTVVALAGCWPYLPPPEPTIPVVRRASRPRQTCKRLETLASLVPRTPDLEDRCGHHAEDVDRYWCYQSELAYHAGNLRFWIDRAISECAREDDATTAAEARAK